jgi:hypothetical protein
MVRKREPISIGILSLSPAHHKASCFVLPYPPHYNELKPLAKINLSALVLVRFYVTAMKNWLTHVL